MSMEVSKYFEATYFRDRNSITMTPANNPEGSKKYAYNIQEDHHILAWQNWMVITNACSGVGKTVYAVASVAITVLCSFADGCCVLFSCDQEVIRNCDYSWCWRTCTTILADWSSDMILVCKIQYAVMYGFLDSSKKPAVHCLIADLQYSKCKAHAGDDDVYKKHFVLNRDAPLLYQQLLDVLSNDTWRKIQSEEVDARHQNLRDQIKHINRVDKNYSNIGFRCAVIVNIFKSMWERITQYGVIQHEGARLIIPLHPELLDDT